MKGFRRRTTPQLSDEVREQKDSTVVELEEARQLRAESAQVGAALTRSQAENHFGIGLSYVIAGGRP